MKKGHILTAALLVPAFIASLALMVQGYPGYAVATAFTPMVLIESCRTINRWRAGGPHRTQGTFRTGGLAAMAIAVIIFLTAGNAAIHLVTALLLAGPTVMIIGMVLERDRNPKANLPE